MRPSQPDPIGHCWKPPSMMREPVVSVASACTSPSTTGAQVGMYVLLVALTSIRNDRGLVNAPPTYRLFPICTNARTILLGRVVLANAATGAPVVPLTSTMFLCATPPTVVNEPPR